MSWTTEGVKLLVQLGVEQVILKDTEILFGRTCSEDILGRKIMSKCQINNRKQTRPQ